MKEVGLYVHIPFCTQKCHYCDFNSVPGSQQQQLRVLSAIKKELKLLAENYSAQVKTIFVGGGTPTVLTGWQLKSLLIYCKEEFKVAADAEITIEANPETVTKKQLKLCREIGVNRLSFGVQSLNNFLLAKLGRRHRVQEVINSYYLARRLGFDNLNLDLIFALPGQSVASWQRTLRQICSLEPEHISCYNLKLESGTPLYNWAQAGKLDLPTEEKDLKMYRVAQKMLTAAGYSQYEISNFAQPGFECQHNRIYWLNQPYLGVGPGAHFYDGQGRGYNYLELEEYCGQLAADYLPTAEYNELTREEKIEETMMLGLRLVAGISLAEFEARYGVSIYDIYTEEITELIERNLIDIKSNRLFLTERGRVLANRVLAKFLLS